MDLRGFFVCSPMLFPVLPRAYSFYFCEDFGVIIGIVEAGFAGSKSYGFAGIQIFKAALNSILLKKRKQCGVHVSFEQSCTFTFAEMDMVRDIF